MYIWNEAKWGKIYQRNVVKVTSLHHFFLSDQIVLFVCAGVRESKELSSFPLWLSREQSSSLTLRGQEKGRERWLMERLAESHRSPWRGGNSSGVVLVWWGQQVSLDPAHPVLKNQPVLRVTSHWPESSKTKGKSYLPWNGPRHGALRDIPPTIFLSLLDFSCPQSWCQPWCPQDLWWWQLHQEPWEVQQHIGTSTCCLAPRNCGCLGTDGCS